MSEAVFEKVFTREVLSRLFPEDRADGFFESIFGDPNEGAYNIHLAYKGSTGNKLHFEFRLTQRPGRCLACNLTYGLPQVFSKHPVIGIPALVEAMNRELGGTATCKDWELGSTQEISGDLHAIPLTVYIEN